MLSHRPPMPRIPQANMAHPRIMLVSSFGIFFHAVEDDSCGGGDCYLIRTDGHDHTEKTELVSVFWAIGAKDPRAHVVTKLKDDFVLGQSL